MVRGTQCLAVHIMYFYYLNGHNKIDIAGALVADVNRQKTIGWYFHRFCAAYLTPCT